MVAVILSFCFPVTPDTNIVFDIVNGLGAAIIPLSVVVTVAGVVAWTGGQPVNGWGGSAVATQAVNGLEYTLFPPDGFAYGKDVTVRVDFWYGSIQPPTADSVTAADSFTIVKT